MHTDRCGNTCRQKCCAKESGTESKIQEFMYRDTKYVKLMCDHIGNKVANGTVTQDNVESHTGKTFNRFTIKTAIWDRGSSVSIATGWTVRGSNPGGGEILRTLQTGPGVHRASYTMRTKSFPGVMRPGRGVDHPPHLAPRLKEEQSYTSTSPLGVRGLF